MKTQKLFVIVVSVCLMAFFNVLSFAQAAQVPDDAAKTITNTLEKQGYDVNRFGSSVQFTTSQGKVVDLNFERNGVTLSVDSANAGEVEVNFEADINLIECIGIAVNVYGLKLDMCEFDTAGIDLLCVPEATYDFALNVLRCLQNVGD